MNHNRKVLLSVLIAIICVASIFSAYFVAGLFNRPPTITETRTLNTVTWNATRTTDMFQRFDQFLTPKYADNEISASYLLTVAEYTGDTSLLGCPYMGVPIEVTANLVSSTGFIYDVNISYHQADIVNWAPPTNASTPARADGLSMTTVYGGSDAFMCLSGQNHSRSVNLAAAPQWYFSSNSTVHSLRVDISITYFNGTTYKKLVQPFQCDLTY